MTEPISSEDLDALELKAQNEHYRYESHNPHAKDTCGHADCSDDWPCLVGLLLIAIRQLRAELAEARRDGERLNWLDAQRSQYHVDLHSKCVVDDELPEQTWCLLLIDEIDNNDGPQTEWKPDVRAAIDAARRSAEEEK